MLRGDSLILIGFEVRCMSRRIFMVELNERKKALYEINGYAVLYIATDNIVCYINTRFKSLLFRSNYSYEVIPMCDLDFRWRL